jgi:uncharacterized protein (DUF2336 family)
MSSATTLLAELEDAVASGNNERRTGMLRMITDLFLDAADAYSDEQVGVFDDVMGRLADKANVDARAELAVRLAPVAQAPSGVVTKLAVDDELRVAEPVLRQSPCLDDAFLAQAAQNKGQGHLLAISQRAQLSEVVTDVLLERGDRTVVRSTAGNEGARFSPSGFSTLVDRSAQDEVLAETVCNRADVPEKELGRLLEAAPDGVRQKLMGAGIPIPLVEKAVYKRDYANRQDLQHRRPSQLAALGQDHEQCTGVNSATVNSSGHSEPTARSSPRPRNGSSASCGSGSRAAAGYRLQSMIRFRRR